MLDSTILAQSEALPGFYPRLLGSDWSHLAEPLRRAHTVHGESHGRGRFQIDRGHHVLSRALGWLLNLPPASPETEAHVTVTPDAGGELWVRRFGTRRIVTHQYEAAPQVFAERFGIVEFRFRLEVAEGNLFFHQRGVTIVAGPLRVPLPTNLAPRIEATETMSTQGMHILVRIVLPLGGLLLSYQGIVEYSVEKV